MKMDEEENRIIAQLTFIEVERRACSGALAQLDQHKRDVWSLPIFQSSGWM